MPKFKSTFALYRLDERGFITALDRKAKEGLTEAMREFLRAVVQRVPLYTGMSRGSLIPLARFLGIESEISLSGAKPRGGKSPEAGARLGQDFQFEAHQGRYTFSFNPQVVHYRINEFLEDAPYFKVDAAGNITRLQHPLRLKHKTPWHSFVAGRAAFERHLRTVVIPSLPRLRKYILEAKVTVGR